MISSKERHGSDAWPLLLTAAGLALRLCSWRAVFRGGGIFFVDPDDYYHLRRMMTAAANFPRLPSFDAYLGFPEGFHCNWPPLYDWLAGVFMIGASLRTSQLIAAFIPPIAGALTIWVLYKAALRAVSRRAALWAAGIYALLPMPAFYTMLGRPDHHCVENLFFAAALWAGFRLIDANDDALSLRRAWTLSAILAAGLLCWIGSFIFWAALFFLMVPEIQWRSASASPPRSYFWICVSFFMQLAFVAPFCVFSHFGRNGAVDFDAPSWFQPLGLMAAGTYTLGLYLGRQDERARRNAWKSPSLPMILGGFVLCFYLFATVTDSVAKFTGGALPVFQASSEMQPLFAPYHNFGFGLAAVYFGWSLWLAIPLSFVLMAPGPDRKLRLVGAWGIVSGAAMLWQTRYAYHFCLPAALALGWEADRALAWLEPRLGSARAWGLALAAAFVIFLPGLHNSLGLLMAPAADLTIDADLVEACDWLRGHTPPTRSLFGGDAAPEYGVYAWHDHGGPISAIAQRPAAAGNMHVMRRQILDSAAFFLMEDAEKARDFLAARRFRYVVLGDIVHDGSLSQEAAALHQPAVEPRLWNLVYARLYVLDGSLARRGRKGIAAVGGLRLVHESPVETYGVRRFKVFEVVPGLTVSGRCAAAVEASVPVRTDQGRAFSYSTFAPCEGRRFSLNLPYQGDYAVASRGEKRKVSASEAEVENGAAKALSFD